MLMVSHILKASHMVKAQDTPGTHYFYIWNVKILLAIVLPDLEVRRIFPLGKSCFVDYLQLSPAAVWAIRYTRLM
jgi:hypothetical protein